MKKLIYILLMIVAVAGMTSCGDKNNERQMPQPKDFVDSLSYYMGLAHADYVTAMLDGYPKEISSKIDKQKFMEGFAAALQVDKNHIARMYGINHGVSLWQQNQVMKNAGVPVDYDVMLAGFSAGLDVDTINGTEAIIAADNALFDLMNGVNRKIIAYQTAKMAENEAARNASSEKNKAAGEAFVKEQLKADSQFAVTESGLVYKFLKNGEGEKVKPSDTVKLIYTGKFVDGSEFDSSEGRAVEFMVDGVIAGFREALLMMNKGSKMQIIVPDSLAYGKDAPPMIGPSQTLVFDLELVEIGNSAQ
ncbi:MAG: FKBP-type peptidyl-prolyl cis-trans isomerase [Paramuribaculum sp.]|nr:FKBP-type peptidyl-prolyl cis-trans isomerase [Paramuribaculum sp.]